MGIAAAASRALKGANWAEGGFAELAGYDLSTSGGNGDGLISASDAVWAALQGSHRAAEAANDNDAWRAAAFHFVQSEAA